MRDTHIIIYYGYIEDKKGNVTRYAFNSREAARKFIAENFDTKKHSKCWTD